MNTLNQIEAVKNKVGHVPHNHRATYCNGMALQAVLREAEAQVMIELQNHPAPQALHIPNSTSHPFLLLQTTAFQNYTANRIILDLLEATPAWKEAHGILQPLVDELAELEAQLAAEVAERGARRHRLAEAEQAALERAQAAALEDPAVVKAKRELEALESPVKIAKAKPAEIGEVP